MSPVKVISRQPPGGRCTPYGRYADAIAEISGWSHRVVHSECRDAHADGFPSLWIRDVPIQPGDGVILTPEDICEFLKRHGVAAECADGLLPPLQAILDDFLDTWNPGT